MRAVPLARAVRLRDRLGTLRGDRGASSLELAMYTPIILLLLSLVLQAGLVHYANNVAAAAAREGARVARSEAGTVPASQAAAEAYAEQVGSGILNGVQAQPQRDLGTGFAEVVVTGRAIEVLPGFPLEVRKTSRGPIERFIPDS